MYIYIFLGDDVRLRLGRSDRSCELDLQATQDKVDRREEVKAERSRDGSAVEDSFVQ